MKPMINFTDAYRGVGITVTRECQHRTEITTILTGVVKHLSIALKCKMYDTYAIISRDHGDRKVILLEFIDYPLLTLDYQITDHDESSINDISTTIDIAKPDSITQLTEIFKQVYG